MVTQFEKFSLNISISLFVIRVNLLHPYPSLFLYGLLLCLKCFPIILKYYFQVSFNFKVIFVDGQNNSKHRDVAPLNFVKSCFLQNLIIESHPAIIES